MAELLDFQWAGPDTLSLSDLAETLKIGDFPAPVFAKGTTVLDPPTHVASDLACEVVERLHNALPKAARSPLVVRAHPGALPERRRIEEMANAIMAYNDDRYRTPGDILEWYERALATT